MMRWVLVFLFVFTSGAGAQTSFRGYQKKTTSQAYVIHERIVRFQKEPKDFYLYLTNNEALFRFPRSADLDQQVESFLKSRKSNSRLLKIELDRLSGEIYFMGDLYGAPAR